MKQENDSHNPEAARLPQQLPPQDQHAPSCWIVIEPRRFLGESVCQAIQGQVRNVGIQLVEGAEEAIHAAFLGSEPQHTSPTSQNSFREGRQPLFFLGGRSYSGMIKLFRRISSCFRHASYVLIDDVPRMGSGLTVDLTHILGYLSLSDRQESWDNCLQELQHGQPAMTPQGQEHLAIHHSERRLVSQKKLRNQNLFALTEREWLCFQHLSGLASMGDTLKSSTALPCPSSPALSFYAAAASFP